MADKTANNVTNATAAANVSVVAKTSIRNNSGTLTPQANKPQRSWQLLIIAAAKPFFAISKKRIPKHSLPRPNAPTS